MPTGDEQHHVPARQERFADLHFALVVQAQSHQAVTNEQHLLDLIDADLPRQVRVRRDRLATGVEIDALVAAGQIAE